MRYLEGATVVFDLDGTLVDTAPDILRALDVVLAEEGLPGMPAEAVRRMVGQGAYALISRAAASRGISWDHEKLHRLTGRFVDVYASDIAGSSAPFQGIPAALDDLLDAGAVLTVCTNKRTGLSEQLLRAVGLRDRFAAVVGADAVPNRKPDPGHYLAAVAQAGGSSARSVMVGDSDADVNAAKAAGAPVIVYRFGYCEKDVGTLGADVLISEFDELGDAVRRLL